MFLILRQVDKMPVTGRRDWAQQEEIRHRHLAGDAFTVPPN